MLAKAAAAAAIKQTLICADPLIRAAACSGSSSSSREYLLAAEFRHRIRAGGKERKGERSHGQRGSTHVRRGSAGVGAGLRSTPAVACSELTR
jgi:hypothetical protein